MTIREKIEKLLLRYITQAQFVFRSEYFTKNDQVKDTNTVQYEFINQGESVVEINGMQIFPSVLGAVQRQPIQWKGEIANNENDVTVYAIKFIPDGTRVCQGTVGTSKFQPCSPPALCTYQLRINIGGIQLLNIGGLPIDCSMSEAAIQAAVDAVLFPQFIGKVHIHFSSPSGFGVTVDPVSLPFGNSGILTLELFTGDITCNIGQSWSAPMTCVVTTKKNKLLVIHKCLASVRDQNP